MLLKVWAPRMLAPNDFMTLFNEHLKKQILDTQFTL